MGWNNNVTCDEVSYGTWHKLYDNELVRRLGMDSSDLPDLYSEAEAYECGTTVADAVDECIAEQLDDMGLDPDDEDSLALIGL